MIVNIMWTLNPNETNIQAFERNTAHVEEHHAHQLQHLQKNKLDLEQRLRALHVWICLILIQFLILFLFLFYLFLFSTRAFQHVVFVFNTFLETLCTEYEGADVWELCQATPVKA